MKLRNKRTGEIYDFKITPDYDDVTSGWKIENKDFGVRYYSHLAELNAEWCDVEEEPKEHWHIRDGEVYRSEIGPCIKTEKRKEIGNYFETEEEAEKTVKKLKAWKRLKDKGFSIYSWDYEFDMVDKPAQTIILRASAVDSSNTDLDLLFGGEE